MEQSSGGCPPFFAVDEGRRPGPGVGEAAQIGSRLVGGRCPAQEVAGLAAVGCLALGEPPVKVCLPAGRESELLGGEPVEQDDRAA
ncbi:MAG: hypothetical protein ACRDTA_07255 [Pseudonocardiaceae bacterium]